MTVTRYEQTVIPQTEDGKMFAKEYSTRLKMQGAFAGIVKSASDIIIRAKYDVGVTDRGNNAFI